MRLASQTTSHNIPTTNLRINVLFEVARAENSPTPIARYVRNTARANNPHASKVFLLLLCLVRIVESNKSITANAHGLILSEIAAGSIIQKNDNLSFKLFSTGCIPHVEAVSLHAAAVIWANFPEKYSIILVSPLIYLQSSPLLIIRKGTPILS